MGTKQYLFIQPVYPEIKTSGDQALFVNRRGEVATGLLNQTKTLSRDKPKDSPNALILEALVEATNPWITITPTSEDISKYGISVKPEHPDVKAEITKMKGNKIKFDISFGTSAVF